MNSEHLRKSCQSVFPISSHLLFYLSHHWLFFPLLSCLTFLIAISVASVCLALFLSFFLSPSLLVLHLCSSVQMGRVRKAENVSTGRKCHSPARTSFLARRKRCLCGLFPSPVHPLSIYHLRPDRRHSRVHFCFSEQMPRYSGSETG